MTFSYSLSTNVGKVRNLIGDTVSETAVLSDEEIDSFISMYGGDLFTAAAGCLRRMAASKGLLAKRVTAGDYSEDTTQTYKAMLEVAERLEDMAKAIPADAQVEIIYNDFNYNNILMNKAYRGESFNE